MVGSWKRISLIAATVFTLCLAVGWPSAAAAESYLAEQPFVEHPADLVADTATDTGAVQSDTRAIQRLPESPGGVIAKVTSEAEVTTCEKVTPSGGAVGSASTGIRGPTPT